jgi:Uncharacterized protein conserved in bacteria (DUF2213)
MKRLRTHDWSVTDFAGFYAPERVGRTRRLTPEGFLVLEGTPIARTGEQVYGAHELKGLKPNGQGQIIVQRLPEEVFRDETLQSAEGKDFVIEHPPDGVDVTNWKNHTVGHVQNVRRGTGIEDDLIVADILVKDPRAIEWVNKNLPEISSGYDADYEQTEPGKATQRNIVINHVAAVKAGRAGARVAVRDHSPGDSIVKTTSDARLDAVEIGKVLDPGICWTGNVKADVSAAVNAVRNWVTPFCTGHVLTAEPVPPVLQSGIIYAGELVRDAVYKGDQSKRPLSRAMDQLNSALKTNPPRVSAIEDAMELVERMNNGQKATQTQATGDGQTLARNALNKGPQTIKTLSANAKALWASNDRVTRYEPYAATAATRDAATSTLTRARNDTRDLIQRMNNGNRAFHGQGNPRRDWEDEFNKRR